MPIAQLYVDEDCTDEIPQYDENKEKEEVYDDKTSSLTSSVKFKHSSHGYDDTTGLSEVIDIRVWNLLDLKTKNRLKTKVLSMLRPQGIEQVFWDQLSESVKTDIINSLKVSKQKQRKIDVKPERPEEVDPNLWKDIHLSTQQMIIGQLHAMR